MAVEQERLARALEAIDQANGADPVMEPGEGGAATPRALLYGQRMSHWLQKLEPAAGELLRLAVRAQHIRRWERPRGDYPLGRAGYLKWKSDLARFHAQAAGEIMAGCGYGPDEVERVGKLIQKKDLRHDREAQTLEDTACLVFLAHYLGSLAGDQDKEKMVSILQKSWAKMSLAARSQALKLNYPAEHKTLLALALAGYQEPAAGEGERP